MKLLINESVGKNIISESLNYHLKNKLTLEESCFRIGSESWCDLVNEVRNLNAKKILQLSENDKDIVQTDAGSYGEYLGEDVPLDAPFIVEVNGREMYSVFTNDENGKTVKINFKG